jgi:hypothetical protein
MICFKNTATGAVQNYGWALQSSRDYWLEPGDDRLRFKAPVEFFRSVTLASAAMPQWLPALASGIFGVGYCSDRPISLQPPQPTHRDDAECSIDGDFGYFRLGGSP